MTITMYPSGLNSSIRFCQPIVQIGLSIQQAVSVESLREVRRTDHTDGTRLQEKRKKGEQCRVTSNCLAETTRHMPVRAPFGVQARCHVGRAEGPMSRLLDAREDNALFF